MSAGFSLRTQLLLLIGMPLLILLFLEAVVAYRINLHTANVVFDRWLVDSAQSLAQEIRMRDGEILFEADRVALEVFAWDEFDQVYFQLASPAQELIAGSPAIPMARDLALLRGVPFYEDLEVEGRATRAVRWLGYPADDSPVIVTVAETTNKRRTLTSDLLREVLISKGILLLAALLVIGVAIDSGLRPLVRLGKELGHRSPQDLAPIDFGQVPGELRGLVENTNQLLKRIESAIGAREQFIGNVVHQIRTPLAGIKLHAQLASDDSSSEEMRQALADISYAVDHMDHVNLQLLKLARAEAAFGRGLRGAKLDLVQLVRGCCENLASRALERNIQLDLRVPRHAVSIFGEATLLAEMTSNLIENGILYGRQRGHVWVHIDERPGVVDLVIEDDGPGIPREHWPRIFERFFRPPQSSGEGCGLGLPIVREIALAHGASIFLEDSKSDTGTRFVVRFDVSGHGPADMSPAG